LKTAKVPKKVLEIGMQFCDIDGRGLFDKHVYRLMGDEDKLLVVKFASKHHGNVVLEHRIGYLAETYDYIYAFVWRKTRKK